MRANNMAAMILAGGRGSRLHDLTKKVAKPAVHFGGKYRIIDFPLSNCANSGISNVGVLTQYESVLLNAYVAKDQFWGLDTNDGGVYVLTPRERDHKGLDVYRGTADAITQNIDFLDEINPIHHSRLKIRGYSYHHILFLININHIAAVTKGQVNPCFLVHDPPKISIIQSLIAVVFNSHGCCHLFNPTR